MKKALLLALLLTSCDGVGEGADPPLPPPPAVDAATAGSIGGKVLFKGTPPPNPSLPVGGNAECAALHVGRPVDEVVLVKDGRLRNVLVRVKQGLEMTTFPWPAEPVRISNTQCVYVPRVAAAQVHQPLLFVNDDPTDHNIHGFTEKGPFNFTLRGKGAEGKVKIRHTDVMVRLRCDLHPWMVGYVGVVPHPFFAVTGPDGTFQFKGLPPGEYVLEAWHEKYGTQTRPVKLDPKGIAEVEFSYAP